MKSFEKLRCEQIALELEQQYGLVVRYGDPSEFYVSPLPPAVNNPGEGYFIERVDEGLALIALKGIRAALRKYPKNLLKKYLTAVFISGKITKYDFA